MILGKARQTARQSRQGECWRQVVGSHEVEWQHSHLGGVPVSGDCRGQEEGSLRVKHLNKTALRSLDVGLHEPLSSRRSLVVDNKCKQEAKAACTPDAPIVTASSSPSGTWRSRRQLSAGSYQQAAISRWPDERHGGPVSACRLSSSRARHRSPILSSWSADPVRRLRLLAQIPWASHSVLPCLRLPSSSANTS